MTSETEKRDNSSLVSVQALQPQRIPDRQCEKILLATYWKERSARELSDLLDIPIIECFWKNRVLEKRNLIFEMSRVILPAGNSCQTYRANITSFHIDRDGKRGCWTAWTTQPLHPAQDLGNRWKKFGGIIWRHPKVMLHYNSWIICRYSRCMHICPLL